MIAVMGMDRPRAAAIEPSASTLRTLSTTERPAPALPLRTRWRWALLAACLAWLALVASRPLASAAGWSLADGLRWLLQPICHQLPARSPHLFGEALAACHRCVGLYVGFTAGVAVWPLLPALARKLAANPRCVVLFLLPLGVDWALLENTAASRLATGAIASFPVALLALLALAQFRTPAGNHREDERQ